MKGISEVDLSALEWTESGMFAKKYTLQSGNDVVGKVNWQSYGGSLATGITSQRTWTFKRTGFAVPRVTVRRAGEDDDIARFTPISSNKGELEIFDSGVEFEWKTSGSNFGWALGGQALIARYKPMLYKAKLEIEAAEINRPEIPLLVLLGLYILVMFSED
ncbi:MAG TPA: hypothetical protein DEH22_00720 [Chloroflexi bacterium]|nr:hypothetical protein [Chloroflexota bacterium]